MHLCNTKVKKLNTSLNCKNRSHPHLVVLNTTSHEKLATALTTRKLTVLSHSQGSHRCRRRRPGRARWASGSWERRPSCPRRCWPRRRTARARAPRRWTRGRPGRSKPAWSGRPPRPSARELHPRGIGCPGRYASRTSRSRPHLPSCPG